MVWYNPLTWFGGSAAPSVPATPGSGPGIAGGTAYAPDQMGELVVQELTGLPVIWKPLGGDGNTEFAGHPHGEGYSLREWERDRTLRDNSPAFRQFLERNPRASFNEWHNWVRAGLCVRVRMSYADACAFWRHDDDPAEDAEVQRHPITGEVLVTKVRVAVAAFKPESVAAVRLSGKAFEVAGAGNGNALAAQFALAPDVRKTLLPGDVDRLTAPLNVHANAILTVGTGKTYATITLALAAMSSGDFIAVYAGGVANVYNEQLALADANNTHLIGMIPNQGITIASNDAGYVITTSKGVRWSIVENFTIEAQGNGGCRIASSNAAYVKVCVNKCVIKQTGAVGTTIGFLALVGSSAAASWMLVGENLVVYGFDQGVNVGAETRYSSVRHVTACKNTTYGFSGYTTGNPLACWSCVGAGNGTDYQAAIRAESCFNVSADLSAPGDAAVTGFATADFENYAGNDFRLKTSVAATTKARFVGYPAVREDYLGQIRQRNGHFFAGAHTVNVPPTWGPGEPSGIS